MKTPLVLYCSGRRYKILTDMSKSWLICQTYLICQNPGRYAKILGDIVDSTWFVPPPCREKIWREDLSLGLVQNESKAHRLISICTKPRKSFSRQTLSLDKPSGIDNTACCKKVETLVSSRADLFNLRKQVPARPAAALWCADSPGAGGTGRSTCRGVSTRRTRLARGKRGNRGPTQT